MPINPDQVQWDSINPNQIMWDEEEKPDAPNGWIKGMRDPIDGGAQLLEKLMPDFIRENVNTFNNWLVDKGVPLERLGEGGLDQLIKTQEQQYQAARAKAGETGIDWDRLGGNIVSPANLAIASKIPQAASMTGKLATGALGGAGMSSLQPVTQGDYWDEKRSQAAVGGVTGLVAPMVTSAASRIVKPKSTPEVQTMLKEGVSVTPGQALGGSFKRTEEAATSLPIVGDIIKGAQRRGIYDFNKMAINKALAPIREKLPKDIDAGYKAVEYAGEKLSKAYDDILPNIKVKMDGQFYADIAGLKKLASNLPDDKYNQFNRIIKNEVLDRFTDSGLATGSTLKEVESKLGKMYRGYLREQDYDTNHLGEAIQETLHSIRKLMQRQNPKYAKELKRINAGYANFMRVERAAGYSGAKEGIFTPSQLRGATKAMDTSKNKRQFSRGKALMQDVADAGESVISQKVPDSGTPYRAMVGAGALAGGYMIDPTTLMMAGAASLPYLPKVGNAFTAAVAKRPEFAAPIADMINRSYPYLIPGTSAAGYGLLSQ